MPDSILTETNENDQCHDQNFQMSGKGCKASKKSRKRRHRVYDTSWTGDLTDFRQMISTGRKHEQKLIDYTGGILKNDSMAANHHKTKPAKGEEKTSSIQTPEKRSYRFIPSMNVICIICTK